MSTATGLPSCEPTVNDRDRVDEPLVWRGVENVFCGDTAMGLDIWEARPLEGEELETVVAAFCRLGGTLGTSRPVGGCKVDAVVDC